MAMNEIPTKLSKEVPIAIGIETYILPYLNTAKRGFVSQIPLYLIFNGILNCLYTGCQWKSLPTKEFADEETGRILSYQAFYYHFRKWSSSEDIFYLLKASIVAISMHLDLSELIPIAIGMDGTHTTAKKGGESVEYQHRKRAKTSNIFPVIDGKGNVLGFLPLLSGNHNDAYELKERLNEFFHDLKWIEKFSFGATGLEGIYLNADKGFDVKAARKVCFNHGIIPNIKENLRGRKTPKKGRKRLFDGVRYANRFVCERTYAWHDKFRGLLIRFDKKEHPDSYRDWIAKNILVFTMVNLRHVCK